MSTAIFHGLNASLPSRILTVPNGIKSSELQNKREGFMEMSHDHIDGKILGHLLSWKHRVSMMGISVTVIKIDINDFFAVISQVNRHHS